MATSADGGKEDAHLRLPSKLAWLGAVQEGGKPSLGTIDPASLGFFGLCEGSQGSPSNPSTFITQACACKLASQAKSGLLACCIWPV